MPLAAMPSPELMIVADHNASILLLQKEIVEAAQQRPYYTFRNLVYLCWRHSRQFHFANLFNTQLQAVLDDIKEGVEVPHFTDHMVGEICNCSGRGWHNKGCAAVRFLNAIEE